MKIWHEALIGKLPDGVLKALHSDCCTLRGLGWNKRRRGLEYVYDSGMDSLVLYHFAVLDEMERRGMNADYRLSPWKVSNYRGRHLGHAEPRDKEVFSLREKCKRRGGVYAEHDDALLLRDLAKLRKRKAFLPEVELETLARGNA